MANEARLIDANALLARLASSSESWAKNLQAIRNWWPHAVGIKDNIVSLIKEAPTVDAVEVVRCKDCKHWHEGTGWCNHHSHFVDSDGEACHPHESSQWKMLDADDYCSVGERRTDNG